MPPEQRRFGWVPDLPDHRDYLFSVPGPVLQTLPPMVDLRPQCPPVYDQGQLGSCTANAIAGAIQFTQMKENLAQIFTPSRLFIYYNERAMEGTVSVDAGARIRDGIKSVATQGDCPETEWPYVIENFTEKPPDKCYQDAIKYEVVEYQRILQDLNQFKGCLAAGYPFVFGMSVYNSFMSQEVAETGHAPLPAPGEGGPGPGGGPAGHAILAVGYDVANQWFIIRNSWGTGWGMQGYFTLPYAYLTQRSLSSDFWTIRLVKSGN
jgi:C1A family cysteine protease